jgi:hypothetical protein
MARRTKFSKALAIVRVSAQDARESAMPRPVGPSQDDEGRKARSAKPTPGLGLKRKPLPHGGVFVSIGRYREFGTAYFEGKSLQRAPGGVHSDFPGLGSRKSFHKAAPLILPQLSEDTAQGRGRTSISCFYWMMITSRIRDGFGEFKTEVFGYRRECFI